MRLFRWWFNGKTVERRNPAMPEIAVGSLWLLKSKNDPFPGSPYPPVRVIGVKDGWVRYLMGQTFVTDCRSDIETFLHCYMQEEKVP